MSSLPSFVVLVNLHLCANFFLRFWTSFSSPASAVEIINCLLRAPILSTMDFKILTKCIMVASIFFSLSSCAPLKLQEQSEDPDISRNAVR